MGFLDPIPCDRCCKPVEPIEALGAIVTYPNGYKEGRGFYCDSVCVNDAINDGSVMDADLCPSPRSWVSRVLA